MFLFPWKMHPFPVRVTRNAQGAQRQPLQDWPSPLHGHEHKDPGQTHWIRDPINPVNLEWKDIGYPKDHTKNDEINRTTWENHLQLHVFGVFVLIVFNRLCIWSFMSEFATSPRFQETAPNPENPHGLHMCGVCLPTAHKDCWHLAISPMDRNEQTGKEPIEWLSYVHVKRLNG